LKHRQVVEHECQRVVHLSARRRRLSQSGQGPGRV
jgi:hypothetical protein